MQVVQGFAKLMPFRSCWGWVGKKALEDQQEEVMRQVTCMQLLKRTVHLHLEQQETSHRQAVSALLILASQGCLDPVGRVRRSLSVPN